MAKFDAATFSSIWDDSENITPPIQTESVSGETKEFKDGEVIVFEDEYPANSMYLLTTGNADIYKAYNTPDAIILSTLKPGAVFGEMSLFLDEPRTATVVAKGDTTAIEIKRLDMFRLMTNSPDFAYSIVVAVCLRLKKTLKLLDVM